MTEQNNSRLDRIERILQQNAEQIAANSAQTAANAEQIAERQDRTDRQIAHLAEVADRMIAANSEQIAKLSQEISFLRAAVQGHITQSTPPAHQD